MKYRYQFWELLEIFHVPEPALLQMIEVGLLVPEGWEDWNTVQRQKALAERRLFFLRPEIERWMTNMVQNYLILYQIAENQKILIQKLDRVYYSVMHAEETLLNLNQRMTLAQFAAETGYDLKYLQNRVEKLSEISGIIKIPGFEMPVIKLGGKWRISRIEFMERWNKMNYDVAIEIKKRKSKKSMVEQNGKDSQKKNS